jgi:hypothetical protein
MSVIDSLPRSLFPRRSRGLRWLREQLRELGVTAPLSPGCLSEWIADADQAALASRGVDETYAAALKKQLELRARFVHRWTTTDEPLDQPQWSEWAAIARKHLLPRSWTIPQSTVTESHRGPSFAVPPRLVVRGARGPRQMDSAQDLPGTEILSDLKRAGDKSS